MTIDELLSRLNDLSAGLEAAPDDDANSGLRILTLELNKQAIAGSFDPLTLLDTAAPVPVEQLRALTSQAEQAILTEEKRVQLVGTIVSLAKVALRAAGVTLPASF